jgi:hypothetical protein
MLNILIEIVAPGGFAKSDPIGREPPAKTEIGAYSKKRFPITVWSEEAAGSDSGGCQK